MRAGVMLTDTDLELFRWLWMLRVLTLGQLRRVGYYQRETGRLSSLHNVRKRLRRLWNEGYLVGDTLLDSRERIYFLAERALEPLRTQGTIAQRRLYKPKGTDTLRQIHHPLLVSECAVCLAEAVRGTGTTLAELAPLGLPFYHPHTVGDPAKRRHVERFITQEDLLVPGRPRPLRIRPDLVCGLGTGSSARLFFLEADRGFESPQDIALKLRAYHHYLRFPEAAFPERMRWQRYGPFVDFRVLLVTTTAQRVELLHQRLSGSAGFELAAFTTADAVRKENMVFDPIWRVADGSRRALLKREPV